MASMHSIAYCHKNGIAPRQQNLSCRFIQGGMVRQRGLGQSGLPAGEGATGCRPGLHPEQTRRLPKKNGRLVQVSSTFKVRVKISPQNWASMCLFHKA
jgi:hypothetical protein